MKQVKEVEEMLDTALTELSSFDPKDYMTRDTFQFLLGKLEAIVEVLGRSVPDTRVDEIAGYIGEHQLDSIKERIAESYEKR